MPAARFGVRSTRYRFSATLDQRISGAPAHHHRLHHEDSGSFGSGPARKSSALDTPSPVGVGRIGAELVVPEVVVTVPLAAREVELLLEGQAPSEVLAQKAANLAVCDTQPLARNRLKVEVVKALVRKAILNAAA
jgi:hypothetical protein